VTFLERANNAILEVAAEILGLPTASLPRNTRSEMSLPIRFGSILEVADEILGLPTASLPRNTRSEMSLPICFGGMGVGGLVALADAAHVGAAGLAVGSPIRFLTTQDARVRGYSQDEV
jgi:hypothetical protein